LAFITLKVKKAGLDAKKISRSFSRTEAAAGLATRVGLCAEECGMTVPTLLGLSALNT
jgi:hypothetical protein